MYYWDVKANARNSVTQTSQTVIEAFVFYAVFSRPQQIATAD